MSNKQTFARNTDICGALILASTVVEAIWFSKLGSVPIGGYFDLVAMVLVGLVKPF